MGGLAPFAEGDELPFAGAQIVPGHERLGRAITGGEVGRRQWHDDAKHAAADVRVGLDEGHGADRFSESHGEVVRVWGRKGVG